MNKKGLLLAIAAIIGVDQVRSSGITINGAYSGLYSPEFNVTEVMAPRVGKEILDQVNGRMRKLVDNYSGSCINHRHQRTGRYC